MPWEPACHSVVVWPRAVDAELQIRICRDWVTIQGPHSLAACPQLWPHRPQRSAGGAGLWSWAVVLLCGVEPFVGAL